MGKKPLTSVSPVLPSWTHSLQNYGREMEPSLWTLILSPTARIVSAPNSHLLLYTPPLTATAKLLVTHIIGETQIPFCIANIQGIQATLWSPNHSRVIDCTLLTEPFPPFPKPVSPLKTPLQNIILQLQGRGVFRGWPQSSFSHRELSLSDKNQSALQSICSSPKTALHYSCNPPHGKQSQRALWIPLNHLNRCRYYRNEVFSLAAFALSCCSLKAGSSAITKPGWKHSRIFCRVSLSHPASC